MAVGGLTAFIYGIFAIHLRADQIVGGTAINFLAVGITGYLFIQIYGPNGTPDLTSAESIPDVHLSFLGNGFFGQVIGQLNLMIWLVIALLFVLYVLVFKTSVGLRLRAVGEHPRAADTVGHRRLQDALRLRSRSRACSPRWAAPTSRSASCTRSTRT